MKDNRDSIDFGKTSIGVLFSKFFFPTLLGMLFNMAFIFTDGIFVGHGIGAEGLAAINLVGPIMMLISGLGMMFGIGVSVVAAIHLSHGNIKAARINVTQAFTAGILTSMLMGIICYCFPQGVLNLLGAKGSLYAAAYEYYIWFIPTCLFMMVESIGLFVIRLDGSPRYAMISNMIPAVVNIVLDYIFIFPCHWGLMGASLATDIGGLVALLMVAYYMLFKTKQLNFYKIKRTRKSLMLSLRNVGYMVRMGASGLVGEMAVAVMMLSGNLMFKQHIGNDGVAAYSVACYLFPLVYMIYNAVAQSAQPIISFNHGAIQQQRVHKTLLLSLFVSILIGSVITVLFYFFAPAITHIFLEEGQTAGAIAAKGLPYYALGFIFMAVNICMVGYYQSIERAGLAVLVTVLRGIVFVVAAYMILPNLLGDKGLWLSVPVAECSTTLVLLILQCTKRFRKQYTSEELPVPSQE
jgi:putative MATE family efflux protein